jgi:hypothetical protein
MNARRYVQVKLTRKQAEFVRQIMDSTEGATEDAGVSQDSRRVSKRISDALATLDTKEKP